MLIKLMTQNLGNWYWVSYPVAGGGTGVRLVVTRMDPRDIAVDYVACTVYGVCDYIAVSNRRFEPRRGYHDHMWMARKIGFGRGHGNFAEFYCLPDAKVWLLTTVAHRLRHAKLLTPHYASSFLPSYTYEPIL